MLTSEKRQLVPWQELGGHRHRGASDGGDDRVTARGLVVRHEEDRLAASRNLHRPGNQAEREQLISRGVQHRALQPVPHPVSVAAHAERRTEERLSTL